MNKFGFIGAGNMAKAIIKGMLKGSLCNPEEINIFDIDENKINEIKRLNITCLKSASEVVEKSKIIVLAIKPQVYELVLSVIKDFVHEDNVFVSIAAGISINYINSYLNKNCPIIRVMPNTPLLLGQGTTAICRSLNTSDEDFNTVFDIFLKSGEVYEINEAHMNNIIPVNGSSPAYIYLFAKTIQEYAINKGINGEIAMDMICKTFEGCASMLKSSGYTPDELIDMVCSKGGTTIEAINSLKKDNFSEILNTAMEKCTKRAYELSK